MKERTAAFHIERSASMPLNSFILAPRPETLAFFRTTSIFWSSGPRQRMNLVEWVPSGDCLQTASDAAGGKTAEGDSVRDGARDSSRRQGLDRLPLLPNVIPAST